jgi:hypothetical protein
MSKVSDRAVVSDAPGRPIRLYRDPAAPAAVEIDLLCVIALASELIGAALRRLNSLTKTQN